MSETRFAGAFLFRPRSWLRVLRFSGLAIVAALSPSTYGAQAREIAVRQIYFTAWQALAGYVAAATVLSLLLIEVVASSARNYGISSYSLELVLSVLVLEVVPLVTALFVALRSGAAIGAEIALLVVNGDLEDRGASEAARLHAELVPRIAGAALSVGSLTTLGCLICVLLSYLVFYGFGLAGFAEFTRIVANVFDGPALASFLLKCLLFGLAVAIIPVATALEAERGVLRSLPGVVLGGLVKLFFAILVIEVASLVVKYV
jgi:phospholipid/cholesterol/gamma-HCH transport system permease protein